MHFPTSTISAALAAALLAAAAATQEEQKPTRPATRLTPAPAAQDPGQEVLKEQRAEKLAKPVFQKAEWMFDYDKARAAAKEEGKLILVYFTRSYAG